MTRAQARLLAAISWYQRAFEGRPSPCRFYPSCSSYAHEALEVHGARRGLLLTLRRLARCRPFGPCGFDPVPDATPPSESLIR
ncbi:MAG TPA: membrane protein insertion efficiency factor YidD [Ilumatobacteraceae bacterium]|nr:membrane protein insertion efficiency factor YidD [Ilumatobacteraceae bacterium]